MGNSRKPKATPKEEPEVLDEELTEEEPEAEDEKSEAKEEKPKARDFKPETPKAQAKKAKEKVNSLAVERAANEATATKAARANLEKKAKVQAKKEGVEMMKVVALKPVTLYEPNVDAPELWATEKDVETGTVYSVPNNDFWNQKISPEKILRLAR